MDAPPAPDALAAVRQSGITAVNFHLPSLDFEDTVYALATLPDRDGKFWVYSLLSSVQTLKNFH
jgi:hypothetical protein